MHFNGNKTLELLRNYGIPRVSFFLNLISDDEYQEVDSVAATAAVCRTCARNRFKDGPRTVMIRRCYNDEVVVMETSGTGQGGGYGQRSPHTHTCTHGYEKVGGGQWRRRAAAFVGVHIGLYYGHHAISSDIFFYVFDCTCGRANLHKYTHIQGNTEYCRRPQPSLPPLRFAIQPRYPPTFLPHPPSNEQQSIVTATSDIIFYSVTFIVFHQLYSITFYSFVLCIFEKENIISFSEDAHFLHAFRLFIVECNFIMRAVSFNANNFHSK